LHAEETALRLAGLRPKPADNGQIEVWLMNGSTPMAEANVDGNPGPGWHLI
jgi:hypothetical protein